MRQPVFSVSEQQRCRPGQSDQHLRYLLIWKIPYINLVQAKFHFSSLTLYLSRLIWVWPGLKPENSFFRN